MTHQNNGVPAFPVDELNQQTGFVAVQHMGITIRDYFAAKAMQVDYELAKNYSDPDWRYGVASDAYKMADAMLKARKSQ